MNQSFSANPPLRDVADAYDQVVSDLHQLSDDAKVLLQATKSAPGGGVAMAREKLEKSLADAQEKIEQLRQAALQRSRDAVEFADNQVKDHPRESIAIATLSGLALGWLSRSGAAQSPNHLARFLALTVAGTAGFVLWSSYKSTPVKPVEAAAEDVGRWESEGGSAPGGSAE